MPILRCLNALLCIIAMSTSGCARLQLPPDDAPIEERIEAYEQFRPVSLESITYRELNRIQLVKRKPDEYELELANGRLIRSPTKLVNLVYSDSNTALQAEYFRKERLKGRLYYSAVPLLAVGGGAMILAGSTGYTTTGRKALIVAGIVTTLSCFAPLILGRGHMLKARDRIYNAFQSYDDDLKRRLKIRDNPAAYGYEFE